MKRIIFAVYLLTNLFFINNAYSKAQLFSPPNDTLFEKDTINVIGTSDKAEEKVQKIRIEGTGIYQYKDREITFNITKEKLFNVKAHLYPGTNKIIFKGETRFVYFDDKTAKVPYSFEKLYEHSEPDCDNCHKMDAGGFSTELTGDVDEICNECHDQVDGKKNIHPGFEDSSCIDCHNPHFSKYKGHLQKRAPDLCADCHDSVTEKEGSEFVVTHRPVERGECASCHNPHASDNERLLVKERYELCTGCHPGPKNFGHADEYDDCTMCHEPHVSNRFILLKDKYWENCLDCHDEVADQKFKHLPEGRGCGDCHNPHSDTDIEDVARTCRSCHKPEDKEFARFHGGLILPVEKCLKCHTPHDALNKRLLRSKLHFPLTQAGNCVACHEMKTGKQKKLGFVMAQTSVCFKCHGDKKPLVGYDGSVHPPVVKGTCIACHSPHLKLKRKQLLLPLEKLCFKCHDDFVEKVKGIKGSSVHPPVEENDCLACHDPHKSDNIALLTTKLNDLCFECHDRSVSIIDGRNIVYYHEPPTEDVCTNCHSPHSSEKSNLLRMKKE